MSEHTIIWIWIALWAGSIGLTAFVRNRVYATFVGVLTGAQVLVWWALFSQPEPPNQIAWVLSVLVFVHYTALVRPRMRSLPYRALVSWPALWFVAGTILAIPWAVLTAIGFEPWGVWIPYALSMVGFVQSLTHRPSTLDLALDGTLADELGRAATGEPSDERPLRVVHITDTHLGPFVSEARLRKVMERVVQQDADLVLLTGDFMTMESSHDVDLLRRCFEPLGARKGRVFACRGNHDLEAPDTVDEAFGDLGIRLLVDEEAVVETEAGPVQIVGIDYRFRDAERHVRRVSERLGRREDHLRIVLLHHPGHFTHIPDGLGDLVLSGHTHGGQLGLVDLGLDATMLRVFTRKMPDHGFWAEGRNRLYVNRGLGHYGFPLRLGVSAEEALLRIHTGDLS